ncbi:BgTH12-03870 [Blumeria graminis f. sp. triticale]|uniref:BgTH12-03870 n=1 Tax=Blumeria graminis f. sp. triticale TaxID=1689686 RepID=A0A9W4GBR5_BLUGR|nr:BgTH12-03870 [Blumeria graminis f. sp. triticale]
MSAGYVDLLSLNPRLMKEVSKIFSVQHDGLGKGALIFSSCFQQDHYYKKY